MKKVLCLSIVLFASSVALSSHAKEALHCKVRATFSSGGSIGEAVAQEIRQTRSKLSLALYGFSNSALAEDLAKLAARGVTVRLKIDTEKSAERKESQVIKLLRTAGVRVETVAAEGRNHNKFAVIDESRVITGSYNWTLKAEKNWENLLILDCPELAKMYEKEWEAIR